MKRRASCPKNVLEINRYFALTSYCNAIGQIEPCLLHIRVLFGGKTKSPCFDLFIHWLIKQITNTYRNHFSRSYENRSKETVGVQRNSAMLNCVLENFYVHLVGRMNIAVNGQMADVSNTVFPRPHPPRLPSIPAVYSSAFSFFFFSGSEIKQKIKRQKSNKKFLKTSSSINSF